MHLIYLNLEILTGYTCIYKYRIPKKIVNTINTQLINDILFTFVYLLQMHKNSNCVYLYIHTYNFSRIRMHSQTYTIY